jgi:hypothetical protein
VVGCLPGTWEALGQISYTILVLFFLKIKTRGKGNAHECSSVLTLAVVNSGSHPVCCMCGDREATRLSLCQSGMLFYLRKQGGDKREMHKRIFFFPFSFLK